MAMPSLKQSLFVIAPTSPCFILDIDLISHPMMVLEFLLIRLLSKENVHPAGNYKKPTFC